MIYCIHLTIPLYNILFHLTIPLCNILFHRAHLWTYWQASDFLEYEVSGSYICEASGHDTTGNPVAMRSPTRDVTKQHVTPLPGLSLVVEPGRLSEHDSGSHNFTVSCILPDYVRSKLMPLVDSFGVFSKAVYMYNGEWYPEAYFTAQSPSATLYQPYSNGFYTRTGHGNMAARGGTSYIRLVISDMTDIYFRYQHKFVCKASGFDAQGNHVVLTSPVTTQMTGQSV